MSDDKTLVRVLDEAGYNGMDLLERANTPAVKAKLRENTASAKADGICGVPTYRVSRQDADGQWKSHGGLIWGQDESNVVEDLIAGWEPERSVEIAEPRKGVAIGKSLARL